MNRTQKTTESLLVARALQGDQAAAEQLFTPLMDHVRVSPRDGLTTVPGFLTKYLIKRGYDQDFMEQFQPISGRSCRDCTFHGDGSLRTWV